MTREQAETKMAADKKSGFASFMMQPMTRAMLSIIPPSEHLEVMLKAAFEAGYSCGCVSTTISLLEYASSRDPRK